MSITDAARIDALFKKLQGRTNTGINTNIAIEKSSLSHVFTPQIGLQNVPLSLPASLTSFPWITSRSGITYDTLITNNTASGYRAYSDSRITNIIPYYPISVNIAGAALTQSQYILDFDTGVIVIYTTLSGAPTITCYTYTGGFVETSGPTVDSNGGNLLFGNVVSLVGSKNSFTFRGTTNKEYTTSLNERIYDSSGNKSELVLYKGNKQAGGGSGGPDRIRIKSGEFCVQLYTGPESDSFAELTNKLAVSTSGTTVETALTVNGSLTTTGSVSAGSLTTTGSVSAGSLTTTGSVSAGSLSIGGAPVFMKKFTKTANSSGYIYIDISSDMPITGDGSWYELRWYSLSNARYGYSWFLMCGTVLKAVTVAGTPAIVRDSDARLIMGALASSEVIYIHVTAYSIK